MSLARYQSKRDFARTAEPRGRKSTRVRSDSTQILFVIQKHAASRLHYDFRLEIAGVLKSWAVPKGLPVIQGDKRLAMQVEDHPVEYGGFEGTIPPGNYGAGTVMLWDTGVCDVLKPQAALAQGKLAMRLQGHKLKGHWTLVRLRPRENQNENAWLLIKTEEDARPISARADDRSAISGKTMKQISATNQIWQSNRNQRAHPVAKKPIRLARQTARPTARESTRR